MNEKKFVPICVPHLNDEVIQAVVDTLKSGWIGQTPTLTKFEEAFANKYNYKHALAVNSCTSSLRLALALAGVGAGDEVITTPNTFVATNTVILEQGAKPIFADIQYDTGNIDPRSIHAKITDKTKAIMIVHFMGYPCDLRPIYLIAFRHNLPVIEDCAQAIGATYNGVPVGSGRYGCFSFQVVKQITTGDGGMFTTNRKEIYDEAISRSWFGFSKKSRSTSARTGVCDYDIPRLGFKYRMNAINASMGLVQLKYINSLLAYRRAIAYIYREELKDVDGLTLFREESAEVKSSNYMFPIHVERRGDFLKKMRDNRIEAFVHNFRNDRFSVFGEIQDLPDMAEFDETYVCLPLHHEVLMSDWNRVIATIKEGW